EEYEQVLEHDPGHADAHLRLAELLAFRGRFREARSHYEHALAANPGNPTNLLGLARCRRSLGDGDAARATLDRLLAAHADDPGGVLLRGQLELDGDKLDEALPWLRRARQLAPHDPAANEALAAVLRVLKRPDEAQVYEDRARQI